MHTLWHLRQSTLIGPEGQLIIPNEEPIRMRLQSNILVWDLSHQLHTELSFDLPLEFRIVENGGHGQHFGNYIISYHILGTDMCV